MTNTQLLRSLAVGVATLCSLLSSLPALAFDPAELFEKLSPSIWVVVVSDKNGIALGSGSAVVIERERLITNCHVLRKASSIVVRQNNTAHPAQLEHSDVARDLCTLSVKNLKAPSVKIAPLSTAKVGQKIIAIGAPRSLELALSEGLINSLRKDKEDAIEAIQISAPISAGSSGGGLFNMNGELLGIPSTYAKDYQNMNFALPAEWILEVPARSAAALAKQQEEEAMRLQQARKEVTRNAFAARQLQGAELAALIKKMAAVSETNAESLGNLATIDIANPAGYTINFSQRKSNSNARFSVDEANAALCITAAFPPVLPSQSSSSSFATALFRSFRQCYSTYEVAPGTFALREKNSSANALTITDDTMAVRQDEQALGKQGTGNAFVARQLRGAELVAVVKRSVGEGDLDTESFSGSAFIDIANPSGYTIQFTLRSSIRASAKFSLAEARDELCITAVFAPILPSQASSSSFTTALFRSFRQCYNMYEVAPSKFALREKNSSANAFTIVDDAVAAKKERPAPAPQEPREAIGEAFEARKLKGPELLALVKRTVSVSESDSDSFAGSATIDVSNPSGYTIEFSQRKWDANAKFSVVEARDELCITGAYAPSTPSQNTPAVTALFRSFRQCYKMYEIAPDKFALRERRSSSVNAFTVK